MLPCFNGGTCTETSMGGFVCVCLPNYTGVRCEDIAEISTTRITTFAAFVTIPTTTTVVQIVRATDVCTNTSCLNAGTCMPNGVGGFFCQCLNGFVGNRCEGRGK